MNKLTEVNLDIEIDKKNKITKIKNIKFFDLIKTLESGQTFRYEKVNDGVYVTTRDVVTFMKDEKNKDKSTNLIIYSTKEKEINEWIKFFNLKLDYEKINKEILKNDKSKKDLIDNAYGVRIIHTDLWESILTFIISANNNMARIKSSVMLMAKRYGKLLKEENEISFYEIPKAQVVNELSLKDIHDLKVGFRDKYIKDAASKISNNEINLSSFSKMNGDEAKKELMQIKGIGDKVADCIRLFALNKFESFPVDVWIERYMINYDLKDIIKKENKTFTRKEIEKYGENKYKEFAGIVQQYIFYYCITKMK